jgi:hypothetical protein
MVRPLGEVVERRAHVQRRAAGRLDQGHVDGDAARMTGSQARVGDELRVGKGIPQAPLRLHRAEGVENLQPEPERGGEIDRPLQGRRGVGVQLRLRPGIDLFTGDVVGGRIGQGEVEIVVGRGQGNERHDAGRFRLWRRGASRPVSTAVAMPDRV